MDKNNIDFHFIAIGGVGQSALAKILLELGYKVSGSDISNSKYTDLVRSLGGIVFIGHNKDNIQGKPKVIVSSAIKEDNPELIKAHKLNLEIMHRSDCLRLISEKFPFFIGVSGTHGKTTTSGIISFLLEKMNLNPSYALGGILPFYKTNAKANKLSKYFIAELDESDGTIQKYSPDYLIINNLEKDHPDFYKNGLKDIIPVFKKTVSNVKKDGKIFVNIDNDGIMTLLDEIKEKNIITYSLKKQADFEARNITFKDLSSNFDIYKKGCFLSNVTLKIPGEHNIYNTIAAISVLDNLGYDLCDYKNFLSDFSGMGRRFQLVSDKNGITIIDDYAHHPDEIKATLNAIKDIKKRKIIIFQPHRYSRFKSLWKEFLESFNNIDKLFILDTYSAGEKEEEDREKYNSREFREEIIKKGINASYVQGNMDECAKKIVKEIKKEDLILTLGAGDITRIGGMIDDLFAK